MNIPHMRPDQRMLGPAGLLFYKAAGSILEECLAVLEGSWLHLCAFCGLHRGLAILDVESEVILSVDGSQALLKTQTIRRMQSMR